MKSISASIIVFSAALILIASGFVHVAGMEGILMFAGLGLGLAGLGGWFMTLRDSGDR